MTFSDGRIFVWLAAEARVKAAEEIAKKHIQQSSDPLPEWYWALMAQADVYARLSQTDAPLGYCVGSVIEDRIEDERKQRRQSDRMRDALIGERETP